MSAYFSRNLFHIPKYFLKQKVRRTVNVGLFFSNFSILKYFLVRSKIPKKRVNERWMSAYFSRNLFHIPKYFLKREVRRTVNVGLFHFNFPIENIFIVFILVSRLFKTNGKCRLLLRKRNFEFQGELSKAKTSPSFFGKFGPRENDGEHKN